LLTGLLAQRRAMLASAAVILDSIERDGLLGRPRGQLSRSYVHMHVNRLLGPDRLHEQIVLQLLRRTREGLIRAPLA
jgi:thiopeptide-type bacteriocin biosynthesis protein